MGPPPGAAVASPTVGADAWPGVECVMVWPGAWRVLVSRLAELAAFPPPAHTARYQHAISMPRLKATTSQNTAVSSQNTAVDSLLVSTDQVIFMCRCVS